MSLSPADFERARTWHLEIAATLLADPKHRDEGNERRFLGHGGFTVNKGSGAWFAHSAGRGGYSTTGLVAHLTQCAVEEAIVWVTAWLAAHPGTGTCTDGHAGDDDAEPASAETARRILGDAVDITGTPAEQYLKSRRKSAA